MTTISAGAAAGLLVALMVVATSDSRAAEPLPPANDSASDLDAAALAQQPPSQPKGLPVSTARA